MYAEWMTAEGDEVEAWLGEALGHNESWDDHEIWDDYEAYSEETSNAELSSEELNALEAHVEDLLRHESGIDAEAWPAIIGAVVSAIPSIVSGIRGLISSSRGRRPSSRRAPARPSRTPSVHRSCPTGCVPARRGRENDYFDDEAISSSSMQQIMTLVTPIVVDLVIPLLRRYAGNRNGHRQPSRYTPRRGEYEAIIDTGE